LTVLQEQAEALNIAYDWGIQVAIQKVAAAAWLAFEEGDQDKALKLMQQAAEMEASTDKNPVTPGEVLPASELYGDMLLATGDYEGALRQYEVALTRSPNRFYSLYGAARAAELNNDSEMAAQYYKTAPIQVATGRSSNMHEISLADIRIYERTISSEGP
jgi:tetratricopeptide (TPR) repeat protein